VLRKRIRKGWFILPKSSFVRDNIACLVSSIDKKTDAPQTKILERGTKECGMKNVDKNNRPMDNKGNVVRKRMKWLSRP
jgi:hypothetical protein